MPSWVLRILCCGWLFLGSPMAEAQLLSSTLANVELRDKEGDSLSLNDLHGRYVLINLWATWCPPCVKEMPSLQRLQQRMGSKNFAVIPISVEVGKSEQVKNYYRQHGLLNLPLYLLDDKADMLRLKILGLPTTILLNPKGEIVWRIAGDLNWDDAQLLQKLQKDIGWNPTDTNEK